MKKLIVGAPFVLALLIAVHVSADTTKVDLIEDKVGVVGWVMIKVYEDDVFIEVCIQSGKPNDIYGFTFYGSWQIGGGKWTRWSPLHSGYVRTDENGKGKTDFDVKMPDRATALRLRSGLLEKPRISFPGTIVEVSIKK